MQKEPQTLLARWSTTQGLTGNFQWSVATNGLSQVVAGHTGVNALVWFAPSAVHDAQEEKGAAGQEHAVRTRVIFVCLHTFTIFVPFNAGDGAALCLAVEGGRLPLGDNQIRGVLRNPRRAVFKTRPRPCEAEMKVRCYLSGWPAVIHGNSFFVRGQTKAKPFWKERKSFFRRCLINLCGEGENHQ